MTYPFVTEPNSWDYLILGGFQLPGLVIDCPCETKFDIEIGKPNATEGAYVNYRGRAIRVIKYTLSIPDQEGYDDLVRLLPLINVCDGNREVVPYAIGHAQATLHGVKEVLISAVSVPTPNAANGFVYSIGVIEHKAKTKTTKTSTQTQQKDKTFAETGLPSEPPLEID